MLTTQEIFQEYAHCLTDSVHAIETYLETFDKTQEGFVPFKLFPRQKEIIKAYDKHRFNIVTKPRQAGVSTTTAAYMSIKVGFGDRDNPENILIIANKQELAFEFLAKIKDFLGQLPRWVWGSEYCGDAKKDAKSIFITDSKKEIKLPNGSRVKAVATSKDALRGFTPTFLIMDEAAYIDNGAEVFGAALTALGCLTKDSLILTENGLIQLDELVSEKDKIGFTDLELPHKVCNKDGDIVNATQTFVSEYGQTFKIKTKLGVELEGSWKHPILIDRNGTENWVRMNELKIGDKPIIQYGQNYFSDNSEVNFVFNKTKNNKNITIPKKLGDNLDFSYLLGLFVAEGNFNSRGITITNIDDYITNFLLTDKACLGNAFKKVDDLHYQFHSTELIEWFKMFGLDKHNARDKEIPLALLKMPKDVIKAFLQGMFDGDGMSTIKDIKYSSTSKKLIQTLQTLLFNFGIISHVKYEEQKTSKSSILKNKKHICKIYNLKIYSNYAIKFYDEIGFRLDRKQNNKQFLLNKKQNSRFVNVSNKEILEVLQINNIVKTKVRFLERFWKSDLNRLSVESLNRLLSLLPNNAFLLSLTEQLKRQELFYIDEIISITESEDYTYDLHVPETNSFISNGIISHNTGGRATLISCVTEDTFIFTDTGLQQMKDIINYDEPDIPNLGYYVKEYNIRGNNISRKSNLIVNNGFQETIKLTTTNSELESTETHKLWSYSNKKNKYDWFTVSELEIGDYVNVQHSFNIFGNNDTIDFAYEFSNRENKPKIIYDKINTDLAYLIGLYLSEGSCYKPKNIDGIIVGCDITISCGDDVGTYISNAGFDYSSHDNLHYKISSKYLGSLLEYLGFDLTLKAPNKLIPRRLLEMGRENIIAMLQGIMDGDGYSDNIRGRVGINLSSKKLIQQIRFLFLNLGILTDYSEGITSPTKKVKVSSQYYRLSSTSIDADKYYDTIGFRFNRKQIKRDQNKLVSYNNGYRIIPNGKNIIRNIIDEHKLVKKLSNTGLLVNKIRISNKNKTANLSVNIFNEFIDYFINVLNLDLSRYSIDKINFKDSKWVPITKLEKLKNKTYDVSLPETNDFWCHSVIYNGILGHQTPNGMDSLYYKTYDQAKNKKNNFNIVEMRWFEDLRYNKDLRWIKGDLLEKEVEFTFKTYSERISDGWKPTSSWYEEMCLGMNNDSKMIAQELDVSFIGSGGNVINEEYIEYQDKNNVREPKYMHGLEQETWIWEEPIEGHQYILGCLPPNEKVLTDKGLVNIEDVDINDRLISEDGNYVNIINKQIYQVVDEDVFEMQMDNTFRTTTFTKEHPILISKSNLKRNYDKNNDEYKFNDRYWDFDFNYTRVEEVEIGDWVKVPNIYKESIKSGYNNKWKIDNAVRCEFEFESPLFENDFWWFMGMWLGDGWLDKNKHSYAISLCFDKKHEGYIEKCKDIIKRLFKSSPSFIDKGSTFELVFNSKFLYYFILENFGQYSHGKKISEWVKFISDENKKELIRGYFDSDGCWVKTQKNGKKYSKVSFVSTNLELLESVQDIIFSLGVVSCLDKLRDAKITIICGRECQQSETYNLTLGNHDSLDLIKLIYKTDDIKLNKFDIGDFNTKNKRIISSCHFDDNKDYIYFRVKKINKNKFTGNVYNFECDTNTFMCHHITTHNCDVSRGDSEDSSTIVIIDFTTMEEVLEYQGKIQPDLLAQIVEEYGNLYKAYTVVDVTGGMGVSTVLKLLEFDYKYLHYDSNNGKILSARQRELTSYDKGSKIPGFHATNVRVPMISNLEYQIRTNGIKIRSTRMISEMKTFIFKNGRPDHMDGYHDDLLMSLGMGLWVMEHSFKNLERLEKQNKAILNSWATGNQISSTTNSYNKETNKSEVKINPNHLAYKNIQDPKGEYAWLFGRRK